MIPIAEIFGPTIQGEGPNVGKKTLFVRVAGCDFNCSWCDSKFAWKLDENTNIFTPENLAFELLRRCKQTFTDNIVLTGGNPCLYDFSKVLKILKILKHEDINININIDVETQGSKLPNWLYDINQLVISPKAPSSGQKDVYNNVLEFLTDEEEVPIGYNVAIKIPIFNDEDFKFAEKYYKLIEQINYRMSINAKLYLSVGNTNTEEQGDISKRVLTDYEKLINKTMESKMSNVYVLPQVHTLVWGNKQGV